MILKGFNELNLSNRLVEVLKKKGIKEPTSIQKEAIPLALNNKDIIGRAKTGSGKTLAFLLPIVENIDVKKNEIQGMILTPTRELAIQVSEVLKELANDLNPLLIYGGQDIDKQIREIKSSRVIVATPGRLIDHINRGTIKLNKVKHIVFDEADQMLLMGFKNEIEAIMKHTGKDKQVMCFSATIDKDVKKLAYRYTNEPIVIEVDENRASNQVDHYLVETTDRWKIDSLCDVLNKENPFMGIIFCRTKARVDKLDDRLSERGYNCHKIHSDIPQNKREKIMKAFKNSEIQYLIATDVASRGIHIDGVTHVFNYDIPEEKEGFIHRVGRTGRANDRGSAYLFTTPKDEGALENLRKDIDFKEVEVSGNKDIKCDNPISKGKYNKKISAKPRKFKK